MISSERMAAVDRNAEALGVPRRQLMESAGNAVAREIRETVDSDSSVVVVAGRGNNGGDAFVAVRFLEEYNVETFLLGRAETIGTEIARGNWDVLVDAEYDTNEVSDSASFDLPDCDVVVDAMLGTGATGALREPEATAAKAINNADATVVSVDVPSGMNADSGESAGVAVDADHVVTFYDMRPGLEALDASVTVADIGIPDAAELFVGPGDLRTLTRTPESHKGDFGEVLVVGGGPYTGAPALSAQAALRTGADLVRIACPEHIEREVQAYSENLIVEPLLGDKLEPKHITRLHKLAERHDAVVFGPGLGSADETLDAVERFLSDFDGTAVVDADALQVVPDVETNATLICTPHQGELEKMGGPSEDDWRARMRAVEAYADEIDCTLLVKGAHDVISDGETTRVNRTGNPGMTVGGTGDVLAGATAALACVQEPLQAAALGAYVNGRAGDITVDEYGYGLLATDLLTRLPRAVWSER